MTGRMTAMAGFGLAVAAFTAGVWWFALTSALAQLEERGRADLALAADRLVGQLHRYRELGVLLAGHPVLTGPVLADRPGARDLVRAGELLLEMADKTGTASLLLLDRAGRVLAASGQGDVRDLADDPLFARAMDGALGLGHGRDGPGGQRVYSYAAPIFGPDGPVAGAVVVRADIDAIEWNWPSDPSAVFFSDAEGVVFVSNRSDLVLRARHADAGAAGAFPAFTDWRVNGHDIWLLDGGRYLPARALHLTLPLPVIGMTAEILLDLAPVLRIAALQAAVAAALCLAFGALLFLARERRRSLADQLRAEEAANAKLESRVARRTRALSSANADLLREIGERKEAEAALTRAQADLVQAGKLSALGQMSAGLSHELNQPLMAIQSFAENATKFLDRGEPERAAANLGRISDMARRMGRIIRNLRAFARQESAPVSDVDLVAVVDAALEIGEAKITRAGVAVDWPRPSGPVMVRGGEVRLQQVVMNLLANAVDAMQDSPEKRIEIRMNAGGPDDPVVLGIRDTGPGIAEPERMFDPFYTTRSVGQGEGMGLGLSISYGLVQSFGGRVRGTNHPGGGAEFSVELTPATARAAA